MTQKESNNKLIGQCDYCGTITTVSYDALRIAYFCEKCRLKRQIELDELNYPYDLKEDLE